MHTRVGVTGNLVECKVNRTKLYGLIDTASEHSIISEQTVKMCRLNDLFHCCSGDCVGIGCTRVIGLVRNVSIRLSSHNWLSIDLLVVQHLTPKPNLFIIGYDFLCENKCQIECRTGRLYVGSIDRSIACVSRDKSVRLITNNFIQSSNPFGVMFDMLSTKLKSFLGNKNSKREDREWQRERERHEREGLKCDTERDREENYSNIGEN